MPNLPLVETIRHLVHTSCKELGLAVPAVVRETILIRDGHLCGRRFNHCQWTAIWFIEENEIKIYGSHGALVKVLSPVPGTPALLEKVA